MRTFAEVNRAVKRTITTPQGSSSNYSLERIKILLSELGNPQEKFKAVHIAGTSGKTSTAYFIAGILHTVGYRVGLSVSPHINEINERVQIGTQPLDEKSFCKEMTEFLKLLNTLSVKPTYFELFVTFAYWYFAKKKMDYVVVEVGLGGLLDGTNVIKRPDKICVITDIGLDHTHILGDTLAKIAKQKAGIIQPGNRVFMLVQNKLAERVVKETVQRKKAELNILDEPSNGLAEELPGFLKRNWTLARYVSEYILDRDSHRGLSDNQWRNTTRITIPGRLEEIAYQDKILVLDGAHNAQKMQSFIQSFQARYPKATVAVLLAIADSKGVHLPDIARAIRTVSNSIIITTFERLQDAPKKSIRPEDVAGHLAGDNVVIETDLNKAFKLLLRKQEDILLVTGSLYLVGAVRGLLKDEA
ncbi:MAG TPA: Mur ligase family protein [Candidatus Saccharimonadales bacterium]|nr:Mur ligase family protein [Candidatus Saccharimonadales bacterium]